MLANKAVARGMSVAVLTRLFKRNVGSTQHLAAPKQDLPIYKKFDDGYIIRGLRKEELDIARLEHIKVFGAYTTKLEANTFYECADPVPGAGFYAGEVEGQLVTTFVAYKIGPSIYAATGSYTNPNFRDKSYYTRNVRWLTEQKISVIIGDITTKFLTGTLERYGWKKLFNVLAWQGYPPSLDRLPEGVVQAKTVPLDKLVQYDAAHFIHPKAPCRSRLLQQFCHADGFLTLVALDKDKNILGYAVRRPAVGGNFAVGPWYADDIEIAERLLLGLTCGIPQGVKFYVENWEPNEDVQILLENQKFEVYETMIFIRYGKEYGVYRPWIYGVTSEDFCPY